MDKIRIRRRLEDGQIETLKGWNVGPRNLVAALNETAYLQNKKEFDKSGLPFPNTDIRTKAGRWKYFRLRRVNIKELWIEIYGVKIAASIMAVLIIDGHYNNSPTAKAKELIDGAARACRQGNRQAVEEAVNNNYTVYIKEV